MRFYHGFVTRAEVCFSVFDVVEGQNFVAQLWFAVRCRASSGNLAAHLPQCAGGSGKELKVRARPVRLMCHVCCDVVSAFPLLCYGRRQQLGVRAGLTARSTAEAYLNFLRR